MADDTGAPHEIPFLEATDPPAIHTITQAIAEQVAERLGFVGKSIIATEESRTNTAYGKLTTPDQVSSVVLPTDGLLIIAYQALWKNSVMGAGKAAIFLGSNQLKGRGTNAAPEAQEATHLNAGAADRYGPLATSARGLTTYGGGNQAQTSDVTTGQIVGTSFPGASAPSDVEGGGFLVVFAAAGTYDISVQFKSSSGSVTVKERKLWVRALAY